MSDPFAFSRGRGPAAPASGPSNQGWAHFPDSPGMESGFDTQPPSGSIGGFGAQPMQQMAYPQQPAAGAAFAGAMPASNLYPSMGLPASSAFPNLGPNVPGPDMLQSVASNPMAQMGMVYAQQAVQRGMTQYMPGASLLWQSLRYYFDVSNGYVVAKLRRILFPFKLPRWHRVTVAESGHPDRHGPADGSGGAQYAAPVHDENAPDLYIPTMAFVTYVLVHGLLRGTLSTFHPEVLVSTSSNAFVTAILEVALLKAGMYSLAVDSAPLLDLVAYSGYKYVGLVLNALAWLLLGRTGYSLVLLYTGLAAGYFLINTLMPVVRPDTYGGLGAGGMGGLGGVQGGPIPPSKAATSQRNYMVVTVGLLQLLLMWWLGPSAP